MGTRFQWEKKGQIFAPNGRYEWMQSHTQSPSVLILEDRLRVYFTCRPRKDEEGNFASVTSFVDLERANPGNVIYIHDKPLLSLGEPGTFDQFGVMPGGVLRMGAEVWLYYVGWVRCLGVPYNHAIGLAISDDYGISFRRLGKGPLFGRTVQEPFMQNSPFVYRLQGMFHMWYSSGTTWVDYEGRMESIYVLMHATSHDGIRWERESRPCIPAIVDYECQGSSAVIEFENRFHMWFCYRCGVEFRNAERGYRIGYAWSDDLINWHREDQLGELPPSTEGWDSQMVCYPRVVNVDGKFLMFYCSNSCANRFVTNKPIRSLNPC